MRSRLRKVLGAVGLVVVVLAAFVVFRRMAYPPKLGNVGAAGARLGSSTGSDEPPSGRALLVPDVHTVAEDPGRYLGRTVLTRGTVRRRVGEPVSVLLLDGVLGVDGVLVLVEGEWDDDIDLWTIVEVTGKVDAMSLAEVERRTGQRIRMPLGDTPRLWAVIHAQTVKRYYPLPELEEP